MSGEPKADAKRRTRPGKTADPKVDDKSGKASGETEPKPAWLKYLSESDTFDGCW